MSFELSPTVDENRIFIRHFSDVTGTRFDPLYLQEDLFACVRGANCPLVPLGNYVRRFLTGFAAGRDDQSDEEGIIQIRPTNMGSDRDLIFDRNVYIAASETDNRAADLLTRGEVLFNNTNSQELVGKTAYFDIEGRYFCSNHITRIVPDNRLDPQYLCAVLNLYQYRRVFFRNCTNWNNQSGVGRDILERLLIPVPDDVETQKKIVEQLEAKRNIGRNLNAQAKAQLAGIDALLLGELGITPAPAPPNTIENRIFIRHFSEVTGARFAAPSHWKKLDLSSPIFPSVRLVDYVAINPVTSLNLADEDEVSFVPMEGVSEISGQIESNYTRQFGGAGTYTQFQEGDLLWAKITPCMENGKSAIATNLVKGFGFGSTEFHVFRPKSDAIDVRYLHALFRMKILREHARLNFGGSAGHQRVDKDYFQKLQIPLPDITEQSRICDLIDEARTQAKQLFSQAQSELDAAKVAIESMILGRATK
ncbi:Restriction endonuclease S subunit [Abditibacterium utsteinense]|uniref:Restriction endonuclease S subunit n=1 Tax=Abditibacterium utsteinense TaxID=1960156 RepID=A0A2S8SWE8_9BACT|nr:restriction endonuclease subunit S [Abditibacterium utsteinense]PQV65131.1 Restriction endonuclease S subunit [Abditibacterium utsteinense]